MALTHWTEEDGHSAAWTVSQETSIIYGYECSCAGGEESALKVVTDGVGSKYARFYQNGISVVSGATYRLSFAYWIKAPTNGDVTVTCRVSDAGGYTNIIQSDGRNLGSTDGFSYGAPEPDWNIVIFDFIPSTTSIRVALVVATPSSPTAIATVYLDRVSLKRIYSFANHVPRVTNGGQPTASSGSNDVLFGKKRTGSGSIPIINRDGWMDMLFDDVDFQNAQVEMREVPVQGTVVPEFSDIPMSMRGLSRDTLIDDGMVSMPIQDLRTQFHARIPLSVYSSTDFPNIDSAYSGKPRPLWFGTKTNITPIRIDVSSTTGLGTYELADATDAPNGIKSIDAIYSYKDADSARLKDSAARITLVSGTHYTQDLSTARFTIDLDVQVIEVTVDNKEIDFNDGSNQAATLTEGLYTPSSLATEIQSKMDAQTTDNVTCSYSETTHLFTIASDGGTFQLLTKTGTSKDRGVWRTIGFKTSEDKTGATSYASDESIFTSADKDHILRVDGIGFKDDASGTYTGTASAAITLGPDIARMVIVKLLKKDPALISTSFTTARSLGFGDVALAAYLSEAMETDALFEYLEYSTLADIIICGEGNVHYIPRTTTVPTYVTDIFDSDFIDFKSAKRTVDVFGKIRVLYDEDPTTGVTGVREVTNTSAKVRYNRPDSRDFYTYIKNRNDALRVANSIATSASTPPVVASFSVRGKLLKHKPGDKIRLTRTRAYSTTGAYSAKLFRIIAITHQFSKGLSKVTCVEV